MVSRTRDRPRKRTLLMILLLLTGGAIINVAVAWRISWLNDSQIYGTIDDDRSIGKRPATEADLAWMQSVNLKPVTGERVYCEVDDALGFRRREYFSLGSRFFDSIGEFGGTNGYVPLATNLQTGWPMLSMQGSLVQDQRLEYLAGIGEYSGDIYVYGWMYEVRTDNNVYPPETRRVPICPVWPGFAINTIFYATILWLLFAALHPGGFVRRRIRIKRGRCPACAYPVGASEVCTECGGPVKSRGNPSVI